MSAAASENPIPDRYQMLAWGTVRSALALVFFGGLLFLSSGVLVVVDMTQEAKKIGEIPVLIFVVVTLSVLGVLAGLILAFTGVCMTTAAPSGSGARSWSLLATVCFLVVLLMAVVLILAQLDDQNRKQAAMKDILVPDELKPAEKQPFSPDEVRAMTIVFGASLVVGMICYLLALRAIASYFHGRAVTLAVVCYLLVLLIAVGGGAGMVMNYLQRPGVTPEEIQTLATAGLGTLLGLGLWGLITVGLVRGSLTRGLTHSE